MIFYKGCDEGTTSTAIFTIPYSKKQLPLLVRNVKCMSEDARLQQPLVEPECLHATEKKT